MIKYTEFCDFIVDTSCVAIIILVTLICVYFLKYVIKKNKESDIIVFSGYNKILNSIVYDKAVSLSEEEIHILLNDENQIPFVISEIVGDIHDTLTPGFITVIDSFVNFDKVVVDKLYNHLREMYPEKISNE